MTTPATAIPTKYTIKTRFILYLNLFLLVVFSLTAFGTHAWFKRTTTELTNSQQFVLLTNTAHALDDKLKQSHEALIKVAGVLPQSVLQDPSAAQDWLNNRTGIRSLFASGLFLFTPQGRILVENPQLLNRRGLDVSFRDYYRQTVATGKPQISDPFSDLKEGRPTIMMTAPIYGADGRLIAILGGAMDLLAADTLFHDLLETRLGKNGYLFLFAHDRTMIAHPDQTRIMQRDVPPGANKLFDRALEGWEGSGETVNSRGLHAIATFKQLQTKDWILGSNLPTAEAYAAIRHFAAFFFSGMLLVLLLAAAGVWLLAGSVTSSLHQFTEALAGIDLSRLSTVKPMQVNQSDEIGLLAETFNSFIAALCERETSLSETRDELLSITNSTPNAIIMMDSAGLITFWNPAAERIFGYSVGEVLGKNLHKLLVPQEYHDAHQAAMPQFIQSGQGNAIGETVELRAIRKDRHEMTVSISLSSVRLHGVWHAVGILRDISDIKQHQLDLIEARNAAEAANIAKSEFLASMSHEIRTPMNGVIGMTGLLLETQLDDEQRRYAEIVRTSGESLLGLINDILDFSKIEAKKLDLEILDFDLSSLLDDFTATLAMRAQEKGLELLCAPDLDLPMLLRGDPGRLRQILTNLTGNAIKFTQVGEIVVRVSLVEKNENDFLLRFSVRDTGIGIPADKIDRLFNKFSQLDASTTRKYGGTGLGLAISKQLAELMGGETGVNSEEGKGSEFWFTVRLGKQAEESSHENIRLADLQNVRVLIVDDNATNCEIQTRRLASWGMRTTEAQNGPQALQCLYDALDQNDPFAIAMIDMQMPGMDGETLGRTIKVDKRLADIQMVMLTSMGTRGDARHFKEIGFAAYATKPIRHQELKTVLSLVLADSGLVQTFQPIVTRHTALETISLFPGYTARILLAEDNITNQRVALGILKKLGLRADAVANGAEALKALELLPYDLVLMDVQMPEMDGLEATGHIRDLQSAVRNHDIPIIAMTANAMQGDREICLKAGMNDYVSKPVSPQTLAEALKKWLSKETLTTTAQSSVTPEQPSSVVDQDSELPVFDRAGMLSRLMDDEELIQVVVEGFLEDIPMQIAALKGFMENGDVAATERQAHTIKGASANVGGEILRAVACEMEKAAKAGDMAKVKTHISELVAQFEHLKKAMTS
jgi:PAS domain S-box-containing protein